MAESSIFWTTGATGDGATAYTQAKCILWLHKTFCGADNEGVNKGIDNDLEVTGTATPVAVNTGEGYCRGFPYFNSASVDVAIPTPSANTRIDRIVLRAGWAAQTVRITRIAGTEGTGLPPDLVQSDGTTWDIPLAQASITTGGVITVTDEREFLHPNIAVDGAMIDDDVVDSQHYAAGSIDLEHMSANSVDSGQYVDDSIDRVHMAADIVDGTKVEDDAIDSEHIATGAVDLDHMSVNSVDSDQYVDDSIDTVHLGNLQVTSGKLAADAVIAGKIANGAVDITASLANDIVDDTKVGNRVPQFYRRQGGHATEWNVTGVTSYTPGMVRMQAGSKEWTGAANTSGALVVIFPVAFSDKPIGFANCLGIAADDEVNIVVFINSNTTMTLYWKTIDTSQRTSLDFSWFAIGTE